MEAGHAIFRSACEYRYSEFDEYAALREGETMFCAMFHAMFYPTSMANTTRSPAGIETCTAPFTTGSLADDDDVTSTALTTDPYLQDGKQSEIKTGQHA